MRRREEYSIGTLTVDTVAGSPTAALGSITRPKTSTSITGVFASAAAGSGVAISSSRTAVDRIYSDDGGVAIAATGSVPDYRTMLARMLFTADQTSTKIRDYALMGHVKSHDVAWDSEQVAGAYGYLELTRDAGTVTFGGYGKSAGVMGCVETSGTMTINTNHIVAGVASISKLASGLTQTGKTCAFLADIYDTTNWSDATSRTPWGVGLYMPSGSTTKAIDITCAAIGATGRTASITGNIASGNLGDGYGAIELQLNMSGTAAGQVTGLSNWINMDASSSGGGQKIIAQDNGIWVSATGTPMSASTAIIGMRMQYVADGGGNPGALYLFDTNIYSNALTALFQVNAIGDMGGSTGAATGNDYKVPLFHDYTANQTWYVNIYHT